MSDQPKALRLADELDEFHGPSKDHASYAAQQAAVELRRLHALNTEWERKAEAWFASPEAAQRLEGYRNLAQRVNALEILNAELVEALRWYVDTDEVLEMEGNEFWLDGRDRARAVLAKVEASNGS